MGSKVKGAEGVEGSLWSPTAAFSPDDFRSLAEHVPQIVWLCTPDGSVSYMNPQGLGYLGPDLRSSITRFPAGPCSHPEDRERVRLAWQQSIRRQVPLSLEARLQRADGAFHWHLIRLDPVRDAAGQLVKWIGTSTNVHSAREGDELSAFLLELSTDFARMDTPHELVATAMLRLRRQLGAARVTLAEFDHARGQVLLLRQGNQTGADLEVLSVPQSELDGLGTEARKGRVTVICDLSEDERASRLYDRWCGLDGVAAIVSAPLIHAGVTVASLTVAQDSARDWTDTEIELIRRVAEIVWPALEKARADHALAVSEQRLRLAQAVAQIGAWELDPRARSLRFSEESYALFGLDARGDSPLYERWTSCIDPRDRHKLDDLLAECAVSGTAEADYRYQHPTGGMRWIHCRAGMIEEGSHRSIIAISLDITERRKAEEALEEINRRKDEFLAMLAHELRNPLAPIRNAVQLLRSYSNMQPELEWARAIIERQTRHLVRLVDDLLDVSRVIRGKIVLRKSLVGMDELFQHAVETSEPLIRARKHQLHVNRPPETLCVDGDLTRLAQVLANLLNNAAKYTGEGGQIRLDAWREARTVVIRVRDSGPGIAPALLPHVFDPFTQSERTLDRTEGGLGIGLTLVKLLVELHGGTVEAHNYRAAARTHGDGGTTEAQPSQAEHGAEFLIRLPASADPPPEADPPPKASAPPEASPPPEADPAPKAHPASRSDPATGAEPAQPKAATRLPRAIDAAVRVLVVDDNVDAADSIALLLTIDGFEARSVHDGLAALEAADSFQPHVVLLDIGLPVLDGFEVAQRLRAGARAGRMRIVGLSGYGQQSDRDKAFRAGFDEYLVKPIEPAGLGELLRTLR